MEAISRVKAITREAKVKNKARNNSTVDRGPEILPRVVGEAAAAWPMPGANAAETARTGEVAIAREVKRRSQRSVETAGEASREAVPHRLANHGLAEERPGVVAVAIAPLGIFAPIVESDAVLVVGILLIGLRPVPARKTETLAVDPSELSFPLDVGRANPEFLQLAESAGNSALLPLGRDDRQLATLQFANGSGALPIGDLGMVQITGFAGGGRGSEGMRAGSKAARVAGVDGVGWILRVKAARGGVGFRNAVDGEGSGIRAVRRLLRRNFTPRIRGRHGVGNRGTGRSAARKAVSRTRGRASRKAVSRTRGSAARKAVSRTSEPVAHRGGVGAIFGGGVIASGGSGVVASNSRVGTHDHDNVGGNEVIVVGCSGVGRCRVVGGGGVRVNNHGRGHGQVQVYRRFWRF